MSPDQYAELRVIIREEGNKTSRQIGALHKKIDPLSRKVAKIEQWMSDKRCEKHEKRLIDNEKEINELKLKDMAQEGKIKLKFGILQFFAMVIASLVTMIPIALALIKYMDRLAAKNGVG